MGEDVARFERSRPRLEAIAYRLLGSADEAQDVVQETFLRWHAADVERIEVPEAWLTKVLTNLCLNLLSSARARRETYVGRWLPEPLLTTPDVAEDVALADSVSTAMLLVLETLTPTERAVFVLREVFDLAYDEIADAVDKTPAAVRQIAHRARNHVQARRPREQVDQAQRDAVIARFLEATASGDLQRLMDVLAPDVVLLTDGGGVVKAALRPILGREKVLRFLQAVAPATVRTEVADVNGAPGLRVLVDGAVDLVATLRIEGGQVTGLYLMRNPHKLGRVDEAVRLRR